jgi:hypothetical protein
VVPLAVVTFVGLKTIPVPGEEPPRSAHPPPTRVSVVRHQDVELVPLSMLPEATR